MALLVPTGTPQALPDPTLNAGVAFTVIDGDDVDTLWTSVGALPFDVAGVFVANVLVPGGAVRSFRSNGNRWVVDSGPAGPTGATGPTGPAGPAGPGLKSVRATGVTDASGNVTFNLAAAAFAASPVITHAVQTAVTDLTECRVSALSATSVTFNVRRSPSVVILGISVLQIPIPATGVTVHCHAIETGTQS